MNLAIKLFFIVLALGGIVLVFFVSWFWRALIIPMVVIILIDKFLGLDKFVGIVGYAAR